MKSNKKKSPFAEAGANQRKITTFFTKADPNTPSTPRTSSDNKVQTKLTSFLGKTASKLVSEPETSVPVLDEDVIVLSSDSEKEGKSKSKRGRPKPKGNAKGAATKKKVPLKKRKDSKSSKNKNKALMSESDTDADDVQSVQSTTAEEDDSDFEDNIIPATRKRPSKSKKSLKPATKNQNGLTNGTAVVNKDEETQVSTSVSPQKLNHVQNNKKLKDSVTSEALGAKSIADTNSKEEVSSSAVPSQMRIDGDSDSSDSVSLLAFEKSPVPCYDLDDSTDFEDGPPTAAKTVPNQERPTLSKLNLTDSIIPAASLVEVPESTVKLSTECDKVLFRIPGSDTRGISNESNDTQSVLPTVTDDVNVVKNTSEEETQPIVTYLDVNRNGNEETQAILPLSVSLENGNADEDTQAVLVTNICVTQAEGQDSSASSETQVLLPRITVTETEQETQALSPDMFGGDEENEIIAQIDEDQMISASLASQQKQSTPSPNQPQNQMMLSPGTSPSLTRKSPTKSPKTKACFYSPVRHVRDLSKPFAASNVSPMKNGSSTSSPSTSSFTSPSPHVQYSQQHTSSSMQSPSPGKRKNWTPGGDPYYLENFRMIVNSVVEDKHHAHLLNEDDTKMILDFNELSNPSQCLYVRLFQRKWQWKPAATIKYPQIVDNLTPGFEELHRQKFLVEIKEDTPELSALLDLLSGEQMTALGKKMGLNPKTKTKEGYKSALLKMVKSQRTLMGSSVDIITKAALLQLGPTYKVSEFSRRLFSRIFILYSPPQYWDDEENQGSNQLLARLLVDIGKVQYPEYSISKSTYIYPFRSDLFRFHEAWTYHSEIQGHLESKAWDEAKKVLQLALDKLKSEIFSTMDDSIRDHDKRLPQFLRTYTAGSALVRTVWLGIDAYQKTKDFAAANEIVSFLLSQKVYLTHYRGRWHERYILNSKHLKQTNREIRKHIKTGLEDEFLQESHRLGLSIRLERFKNDEPVAKGKSKSKSKPIKKTRNTRITRARNKIQIESSDSDEDEIEDELDLYNPADYATCVLQYEVPERTIEGEKMSVVSERTHGKSVFIGGGSASTPSGNTLSSVELFAMNFYKEQGYYQGLHAEGSLPVALYGLLFWDIIYDDAIPDVFHSPFQPFPLDIHFDEFYTQRQNSIEAMLLNLQAKWSLNDSFEVIERNWEMHYEKMSIVNWTTFESVEQVKGLVRSMGLRLIAGICERLSKNFRYFRSGFPDLVVWNESDCIFAEVKGPGDTLSSKQSLWLDYLISIGGRAEVCHVKSVSNKRIRLS